MLGDGGGGCENIFQKFGGRDTKIISEVIFGEFSMKTYGYDFFFFFFLFFFFLVGGGTKNFSF